MGRLTETRLKPDSQVRVVSLSGTGRGAASEAVFCRVASRDASKRIRVFIYQYTLHFNQ
ncbi:hypothetical protein OROGR_029250 [Orobanche gracilis]